ncbi:NADH-ubiquinone oxidoreductase chain, partial [Trichinella spiralis]
PQKPSVRIIRVPLYIHIIAESWIWFVAKSGNFASFKYERFIHRTWVNVDEFQREISTVIWIRCSAKFFADMSKLRR